MGGEARQGGPSGRAELAELSRGWGRMVDLVEVEMVEQEACTFHPTLEEWNDLPR